MHCTCCKYIISVQNIAEVYFKWSNWICLQDRLCRDIIMSFERSRRRDVSDMSSWHNRRYLDKVWHVLVSSKQKPLEVMSLQRYFQLRFTNGLARAIFEYLRSKMMGWWLARIAFIFERMCWCFSIKCLRLAPKGQQLSRGHIDSYAAFKLHVYHLNLFNLVKIHSTERDVMSIHFICFTLQ
jgi:hypothetical protein